MCVPIHIYTYIYMYRYMHIYTYIHIYISVYISLYIFTSLCAYIYPCIYVLIYIYKYVHSEYHHQGGSIPTWGEVYHRVLSLSYMCGFRDCTLRTYTSVALLWNAYHPVVWFWPFTQWHIFDDYTLASCDARALPQESVMQICARRCQQVLTHQL